MTIKTIKTSEPPSGANGNDVRLFVDAIEAGRARLLLGTDAFEVPARLLPVGAKEGCWVSASWALVPAAADDADAAAIRRRLSSDDDGGDIKL